jgi:hypothetical protein
MVFLRRSIITGKLNKMSLPLSIKQYNLAILDWQQGTLIQDAFPMLTATQRDFIILGMGQDEQDKLLGTEE